MNKVVFTPAEIIQREYRIGNYCWLRNKRGKKDAYIDVWDARRIEEPYTLYLAAVGDGFSMPVELNPDILKAIPEMRMKSPKWFESRSFEPLSLRLGEDDVHYNVMFDDVLISSVRYVHQLQNVFHDITGMDLSMPIREMLSPMAWYEPKGLKL